MEKESALLFVEITICSFALSIAIPHVFYINYKFVYLVGRVVYSG